MPKATGSRPLSCLFAVNKPSGPLSMTLLNRLQPLFAASSLFASASSEDADAAAAASSKDKRNKRFNNKKRKRAGAIKMGQGGTLDPLADGVLVIGVNGGTKQLGRFLHCTKEYTAIAMLGAATDTYDAQGKISDRAPWKHVTREQVAEACKEVKSRKTQIPPVYSALKMDGQPLHWYARENQPLPRPVDARPCEIHELEVIDWRTEHDYEEPREELDPQAAEMQRALEKMVREGKTSIAEAKASLQPPSEGDAAKEGEAKTEEQGKAPVFEIKMTVGSGTYVRSIVHDIGVALGSAAFVVKLTRTRQGDFALSPDTTVPSTSTDEPPRRACIDWDVFEKAIAQLDQQKPSTEEDQPWEQELLSKCEEV